MSKASWFSFWKREKVIVCTTYHYQKGESTTNKNNMSFSVLLSFFFPSRIKGLSRIESNSTQTAVKADVGLVLCNIHKYDWESKYRTDKSLGLGILH